MPKFFARKSSIVALAVPLGVVLIFLFFPHLFQNVKIFSLRIISFPLVIFNSAGDHFKTKRFLVGENNGLKASLTELSLRLERNKDLVEENKRLKELLAFKNIFGYDTVSAEVIARDPNNWIGSFILNKGASDGLRKGAAVCSAKGLVGKIDEIDSGTSVVMLVTHPGFRAGGMLRESRLHGVLEGDGKGGARLTYLPLDADVKEGEIVVTSGYSREFPKGIVIGRVVFVEKSNTGLFKNAVLVPEANAYDQEEVLCLK